MEVDYARLTLTLVNPETGETHKAPVFVATFPARHYLYAEVQPSQELCHWIEGHVRALEFFGGVPKILRSDNPETGIKSPNYYEPDLNPTYQELAKYYQMAVLPARVKKPWNKGNVENGVHNVEHWILAPLRNRNFFSLAEANRVVRPLLDTLNQKEMSHPGKSRQQLLEEIDQPELRPLPEQPYQFATWKTARINLDYHVAFEKHFYSVPHTLIHLTVDLKVTECLVEIFHHGKSVAVHPRCSLQGRFSTQADHMPAIHRFLHDLDGDWLMRQADAIGPQTHQYLQALLQARKYPQQAYRSCLGVLNLARQYPAPVFDAACQRAGQAHLLSYEALKLELEAPHLSEPVPAPTPRVHENIREETYYH